MKTTIMSLVIGLATFAVQAATFSWGTASGGAKFVDSSGNVQTSVTGGSIALIVLGSDTTAYTDATWLQDATFTTSSKASTNGRISMNYNFTWTDGGSNIIDNGKILAVVFKDSDGNFSNLKYASDGSDLVARTTVSGITMNTWSNSTSQWNFADANYTAGGDVPEPTSGLLTLLGIAGLALRRKRA